MAEVQYQEEVPYRAPNMHRRSGNSRLRVEGDNGPIRSTYDVSNTSTQLILLNNKYSKDVNRLRGQSARSRSIVVPDPIRHFLSESPIDRKTHEQCFDTSSPGHYSEMDNYHRYRFTQGYIPVNTNRHAACVGPQTIDINQRPRTRHRVLSEKVLSKSVAYCPDLTKGEKLYLYNISRVYSTKNLHAINQRKYATVLSQEEQTGRYSQRDIDKYWNYIRSPRQTSWGSGKSSFTPKRTKSAPPGKQRKRQIPQRPETRLERREFSDNESQDTPRGDQEQQTPRKEKGIIETVLAETDDRKSDTGGHRSRGSKKSDRSKTRRSASRSSSSSRSRSSSSSSSSSSSTRRYSSNDTETKHKRASDGETLLQRAKDESQSKESDTQESRATDNEMATRSDVRASDTGDEDTSRGKKEGYSSMSDSRGNDAHLREGRGRPKSRFGRTDANKEDDYDSDSSSTTTKSSSSSTLSSNSDKSKSNKQKKSSKKPMARIEEQAKIEVTRTTTKDESSQQKESDTSVSESKDQSQITTTTDHSTSVSHNNESESFQKKKAVKKKVTRSRYMESRPTRTNSESSLTQSIASNKSSDRPTRQRKSSRSSIKSNRSGKEEKKSKVESSTKLENVTEDGEQKRSKTPYKSITLESKLKSENGDLPSNHKDVNKIEY